MENNTLKKFWGIMRLHCPHNLNALKHPEYCNYPLAISKSMSLDCDFENCPIIKCIGKGE